MFNNGRRNNAENSIWTLHYAWGWINFLGAQRERMQFKVLCRRQTKPGDKQEEPAGPLVPQTYCSFSFPVSRSWWELFQNKPGRPRLQSSAEQSEREQIQSVANNWRYCGLWGNCGNVWAENRLIVPASARQASTQCPLHMWEKLWNNSWQWQHKVKGIYKLLNSFGDNGNSTALLKQSQFKVNYPSAAQAELCNSYL